MSEFNPLKLIEDAVKAGYDPEVVSELDERQLPSCKNFVSWVMDVEYLDIKTPFPLQLQMGLRLFGDVCAYCSDWEFYQKDWEPTQDIGNTLDRLQLLSFGKCPKCNKTRLDQYHDKHFHFPDEMNLLWGMRGSKTSLSAGMIGSYVLHRMLCLPNPPVHFGQLPGQELYMRFVAMTQRQAKQTNWMHFNRSVQNCNWFHQYHSMMQDFGRKKGIEYVRWIQESFAYVHKGIVGYLVGSSNDVERGRTALFTSIDEIGLFDGDVDSKEHNPHETYTTYEKASATLRPIAYRKFLDGDYNTPTAWMVVHSSTKSKTDYIMRLLKEGKLDDKKIVSHKASWEVNPELTEEFLANEKRKDPQTFDRDYGSIPPFAKDPFIDSEELVLKSAVLERPFWDIKTISTPQTDHFSALELNKSRNIPFCLSIDMGRSDCGYSLALLKLKETDFSVVQVAGLWALYTKKPRMVDFDGMFKDFILALCDKINIKLVLYDQWQSMAQIDALNKITNLKALQYSLTYHDFIRFRGNFYQGKLETCQPEMAFKEVESSTRPMEEILYERPHLHLLWQLLSVSEVGNKITKGGWHDDIFRATVLGSTFLWDPKVSKDFEYKGGVALSKGRQGAGLVMAGGSRAGQMYQSNSNRNLVASSPSSGRVLGAFMGRTRKD